MKAKISFGVKECDAKVIDGDFSIQKHESKRKPKTDANKEIKEQTIKMIYFHML